MVDDRVLDRDGRRLAAGGVAWVGRGLRALARGAWGRWRAVARARASERRERAAVEHALARLAASEPRWYDSWFDRDFVARPGARSAIAARDASGVARAWTEQFRYRDPRRRERDVAQLRPLAESFLDWVEEAGGERTTGGEG